MYYRTKTVSMTIDQMADYIIMSKGKQKSPPFPKVIDITYLRDIFQFALVEDSSHV